MPPPPTLPDELVEEVITRLPPDDPALLVRTALVCKDWCRVISSHGFRHRFRQLHRTPPLLGYIYHQNCSPYFVPTSTFRPPHAARPEWNVINARHGRVLVLNMISSPQCSEKEFIVWDPTTDKQLRLPMPPLKYTSCNAALLCAAAGCNHSDCPWGPFFVVFVCFDWKVDIMSASIYSSEQGAWKEPVFIHERGRYGVRMRGPNALLRNAIYFGCGVKIGILEYDMGKQELSMIRLPSLYGKHYVLMTAENGGLGFATVQEYKLCLWSRVVGHMGGHATWAQQRVIELDLMLQPIRALSTPYVYTVAIDDNVGVVFIRAANSLFTIDLRSSRVEEVGNRSSQVEEIGNVSYAFNVVPYTNFCTPALGGAFRGEESRAH